MATSITTFALFAVLSLAPAQSAAQAPVDGGLAPQGRLEDGATHCALGRARDRVTVGPTLALWQRAEGSSLAPDRRDHAGQQSQASQHSSGPCSTSEWAALSGAQFVEAVATSTASCLGVLWTYDAHTAQAIVAARVEAVAARIAVESSQPVANAARLEQMCLYFQIAFFHEFYQAGTDYGPSTEAAARIAIVTLGNRPEMLTALTGMPALRKQWSVSMDSTNSTIACLGPVETILARFDADPSLVLVYDERLAIYYCLFSLQRQIYNDHLAYGPSSPWIGAVSVGLSNEVRDFAVNLDPTPEREPLTNNAIWTLGHFSYLDTPTADAGRAGASVAFRIQPEYSGPWIWSIQALDRFYAATLDDGTVLDVDALRAQVRAHALPNVRTFDRSEVVFETAVAADVVERLYAATKEVTAQFFRKCTFLQPVAGDTNDVVTLAIYASPEDYTRYQTFLFGTSTSNGGIYLEEIATLCTYDRKPTQSIYTLEELLRHEYTHYLDGRFNVTGGFYQPGTLYRSGRIDSYVEGLAEFAAGSTRIEGVLPRRKLVQLVELDSVRMTIAEIVSATYAQGFTFYRYAGLLFAYLEDVKPDLHLAMFQAIRANDPAAVDALEASLAADAALQIAFDAWLDDQIVRSHDGQSLFAEDVPTVLAPSGLPVFHRDEVRAKLVAALPGGIFRTWNGRYRYDGRLTLSTSGLTAGEKRVLFDERMDVLLAELGLQGASFVSAVAWCGDAVYAQTTTRNTVVIEGPLGTKHPSFPTSKP